MKTPPTIPVPLPTDHRLLRLAGLLNVSKRDALGATVEAWAWIQAQATGGIVPQPVALLDTVAEIEGYGEAAVAVGLVGTADGHIVAPAELRQADAQGSARRSGTADDEKRKAYERDKKRKQRKGSRLTGKGKTTTTPPADASATSTTPSRKSRRLGSVTDGQHVMLIWSKKNDEWFYKCTGATPDLTGTVTDQDNPTLADALKALLDARLTQVQRDKGKLVQTTFSPSMDDLVAAARQERDARQAAAAAAARVDDANEALARAADDDDDQGDREPEPAAPGEPVTPTAGIPEGVAADGQDGDIQGTTRGQHGDTGTCPQNVPIGEAGDRDVSPSDDNGLGAAPCPQKCPQDAQGTRPSSSSSSVNQRDEEEDTTTTRTTADHERYAHADRGDDFSRYPKAAGNRDELDRYLTASGCLPPLTPEQAALVQRLADALGTTPEAIRLQGRTEPAILDARCRAAGIDPKTGFPMAARPARAGDHAPTSPEDAPGSPSDTGTHVQKVSSEQASAGIVGAPATTTPIRFPCSGDYRRSGLSQPFGGGLQDDDHAAGERDHGRDIVQATAGSRKDDTAEQQRRRNEALRAVAAFSTTTTVTTSVTPPLNC